MHRTDIPGLYCVGDSTFPGQGVNAVVFSGFACAHRALCDLGMEKTWPSIDGGFRALMKAFRTFAQSMGPRPGETAGPEATAPSGAPVGVKRVDGVGAAATPLPRAPIPLRPATSNIVSYPFEASPGLGHLPGPKTKATYRQANVKLPTAKAKAAQPNKPVYRRKP